MARWGTGSKSHQSDLRPHHLPLPTAARASVLPVPPARPPAMPSLRDIADEADFHAAVAALPPATVAVLYFHAPWAKPCEQMSVILAALASTYPPDAPIAFLALNAEDIPDVSEQYSVTSVPFVVLQRDGRTLDTVSGADAARTRAAVEKYAGPASPSATLAGGLPPAQTVTRPAGANDATAPAPAAAAAAGGDEANKEELFARLKELVQAAPVMLFMKGTPSAPQCGFSRQTVAVLREKNIRYGFFNILADDDVRQGLKEFADWPTFPQLWVDGELVGGLDIVSGSIARHHARWAPLTNRQVKEEFENDPDFLAHYSVSTSKTMA